MTAVSNFDKNGPGIKGNLFGLPCHFEDAELVVIPVPWEVTVSYREGTAQAPKAVLDASVQIDLYHEDIKGIWNLRCALAPIAQNIEEESKKLRVLARQLLHVVENNGELNSLLPLQTKINEACKSLNIWLKTQASAYLDQGKVVGVLGGDHGTPLGLLQALSQLYERFGILQINEITFRSA